MTFADGGADPSLRTGSPTRSVTPSSPASTRPATRFRRSASSRSSSRANRTTIREGLAQLEHQGLIERRQGARCRVLDYRRTGSIELLPDLVRLSRNRRYRAASRRRSSRRTRCCGSSTRARSTSRSSASPPPRSRSSTQLACDVETAAAAGDVVAVEHANRSFHQGVARTTHSIALELLVGSFYRVVDSAAARSGDEAGRRRQRADRARRPGCPAPAPGARRRHRRGQARRSTRRRPPDAR